MLTYYCENGLIMEDCTDVIFLEKILQHMHSIRVGTHCKCWHMVKAHFAVVETDYKKKIGS